MGEDQSLSQPSAPMPYTADSEVYMAKKPFFSVNNLKKSSLLLISLVFIAGGALFGGYTYGTKSFKAEIVKLRTDLTSLQNKTAADQALVKYLAEPEKQWKDLITNSSAVYYVTGIVEKNLPASRPADRSPQALRGRELTVIGTKGSRMTFFVNEGSAMVRIATSPSLPDTFQPYSLSKITPGDRISAIVTAPVFERPSETLDPTSLNLRSEWVVKIDEKVSPTPNR